MENVETEHSSSTSQNESGTSKQLNLSSTHCSKNSDVETAGPSWMNTSEIPYFSNNIDNLNSKIDACNVELGDYNLSTELQDRLLLKSSKEPVLNGTTEPENHLNDGDKEDTDSSIKYVQYESELQMPFIMKIIQKDLSEPYSIYTYRYFIHKWPKLCFLAMCGDKCVGAIVCKLDIHRKVMSRGYIAMLAVDQNYRNRSIGSTLVKRAIREMIVGGADEVVLETEVTNKPALRLYEALGFVRDKRLFRYYLNGVDALRLKLWIR